MNSKVVLIMAAGTGGHVFPALTCAKALQKDGYKIYWLGTGKGLDMKACAQAKIKLHVIDVSGVRGKGLGALFVAPFKIVKAIYQSLKVMRKIKPNCVLGFGGYVTGPGGIAAWLYRVPLVIHEQNAVLGTTNRLLSRFASYKCEAFAGTFGKSSNVINTGNPVRLGLFKELAKQPLVDRRVNLLVLGGSLGAEPINKVVPQALAKLDIAIRPQLVHQAGAGNTQKTIERYQEAAVAANVVDFISDMESAYHWADLVICRAGALTVSELAATGTASLLIPLPHAIDDHQTHNAYYLVEAKAALLFKQNVDLVTELSACLQKLFADPKLIIEMGSAAKKMAKKDATSLVIKTCKEVEND